MAQRSGLYGLALLTLMLSACGSAGISPEQGDERAALEQEQRELRRALESNTEQLQRLILDYGGVEGLTVMHGAYVSTVAELEFQAAEIQRRLAHAREQASRLEGVVLEVERLSRERERIEQRLADLEQLPAG